jgi:hypothetical protein
MNPLHIAQNTRWNATRVDALDEDHEPIANPACYRRGEGNRREYWITTATWRDVIFSDSADEALEAARILCGSRQFSGLRKDHDFRGHVSARLQEARKRISSAKINTVTISIGIAAAVAALKS